MTSSLAFRLDALVAAALSFAFVCMAIEPLRNRDLRVASFLLMCSTVALVLAVAASAWA